MKRHTIPRPPEREAWLTARLPYIGTSEVATVLGASPYRTAGDLAAEKLEGHRQPHNPAMERGNRLEAAVADWWADEHELRVDDVTVLHAVHTNDDRPVILATLDRTIVGFPLAALEVKTTRDYISELPPHWQIQGQAQMLCADLEAIEFAVLDGTMQLKSFRLERDYDEWHHIFYKSAAFMAHIRDGRTPPGLDRSKRSVDEQYATPMVERVDLDSACRPLIEELHVLKARKKLLDAQHDKVETALKCYIGDAEDAYLDGALAATWRGESRSSVDMKAHCDATCRTSSPSTRKTRPTGSSYSNERYAMSPFVLIVTTAVAVTVPYTQSPGPRRRPRQGPSPTRKQSVTTTNNS